MYDRGIEPHHLEARLKLADKQEQIIHIMQSHIQSSKNTIEKYEKMLADVIEGKKEV
jgi:hypothetical protein